MKCIVEIKMDNAAFFRDEIFLDGDELAVHDSEELVRILRHAADALDGSRSLVPEKMALRDYNGNTVGSLTIEGD